MIKGLCVIIVLIPGLAHAGNWDLFDEYCLTPLEATLLTHPEDLPVQGYYKNDGDTFTAYALSGSAALWVSDAPQTHGQWCSMTTRADVDAIVQQYEFWLRHPDPEQIYSPNKVTDTTYGTQSTVRSIDWREPLLDVTLWRSSEGDWVKIEVRDTNLES